MLKNRSIPFGYCIINGKYALNTTETATRPNINGVVNTAQSAVHLATMVKTVAK